MQTAPIVSAAKITAVQHSHVRNLVDLCDILRLPNAAVAVGLAGAVNTRVIEHTVSWTRLLLTLFVGPVWNPLVA